MRSEVEIQRALEVMMKAESDAVGMGGNAQLIGAIFVGTLRFVLSEKGSPWPKWLEDLERAQRHENRSEHVG